MKTELTELLSAAKANLNKLAFQPMPPDAGPQGMPPGMPVDPNTGMPIDPNTGQPMDPNMLAQMQGAPPGMAPPPGMMPPPGAMPPPGIDPLMLKQVVMDAMTEVMGRFFGQQMMQNSQMQEAVQSTMARLDEIEAAMQSLMQVSGVGGDTEGLNPDSAAAMEMLGQGGGMEPKMGAALKEAAVKVREYCQSARKRLKK